MSATFAFLHHLAAFNGSEAELRAYMARFGYRVREIQGEFSRDLMFLAGA